MSSTLRNYRFNPLAEAIVVFIVIFSAIFFVSYFIYVRAIEAQEAEIKESLILSAGVIKSFIDADLHETFVSAEDEYTEAYQSQIEPLARILDADINIAFVYTAVMRDDKVYFILDATPEGDADEDGVEDSVAVMEEYEDPPPDLIFALKNAEVVASGKPYTDSWGTFVSGYMPLENSSGEFVAVLGVDLEKSNYYSRLEPIKRATVRAMVAGFLIAYLIGSIVWFLRHFASQLNNSRLNLVRKHPTDTPEGNSHP